MRDLSQLHDYINGARPEVRDYCLKHIDLYTKGRKRTHPGIQKKEGGFGQHILQVIERVLELNQECDQRELVECVLVHDLPHCDRLPFLSEAQMLAIAATKGKATYSDWRHTPHYKFVVLILIADMWSAFINEKNL